LSSSLCVPSPLFFRLLLLICLGLLPSCFSFTALVHDHLRCANVGAIRLRDRDRTAGARAAIGSAAVAAGQV